MAVSFGFSRKLKTEKLVHSDVADQSSEPTDGPTDLIPQKKQKLIIPVDKNAPSTLDLDSSGSGDVKLSTKDNCPVIKYGLLLDTKAPDLAPVPSDSDYETVPIDQFGLGMLRGMGWKETDTSVTVAEPHLRPKGLGLGATASTSTDDTATAKGKEEDLKLSKGAYVRFEVKQKDFEQIVYGTILSFDDENGRVLVRPALEPNNVISKGALLVTVVSKKEFDRESKCINKSKFDSYRDRQAQQQQNVKRESETDDVVVMCSKGYKSDDRSSRPNGHAKMQKTSFSRNRTWVRPDLRVRIVSRNYKGGKYFKQKVIVEDVLTPTTCTCRSDDGVLLELDQDVLESVVPRSDKAHVLILSGTFAAQIGQILERNKDRYEARVQPLRSRSNVVTLAFEDICEFVGDPSDYE